MSLITEPCVVDGMPDAEYHADPVEGGSLSSTGARTLLRSPALYQWEQAHRVEKDTYDVGHAVHYKVLGVGAPLVLCNFDSWRTKDAREAKVAARLAGGAPILTKDAAVIDAMAEAMLAHPLAKALLEKPGKAEQSIFAPDPTTGVWLRARIDRLPDPGEGRTIAVDVKTAISADPYEFRRSAAGFGYDVQAEWYQAVLRMARGDTDTAFIFAIVEKDPPHLVSVVELVAEFPEIGRRKMRRAIDTFNACRDSDEWPGYEPIVHAVEPPRWYVYQDQEEELTA